MATILDKDITRETKVLVDGREVQITLTEAQTITMKLKGMKSGIKEIGIEVLYNQLVDGDKGVEKGVNGVNEDLSDYEGDSRYLISLHEIRHAMMVKPFDIRIKTLFESFLVELIKERKKVKDVDKDK